MIHLLCYLGSRHVGSLELIWLVLFLDKSGMADKLVVVPDPYRDSGGGGRLRTVSSSYFFF